MNARRPRRRFWKVSIPLIILAAIVSDISGFKFGYYLFAGMLLAGFLAGCETLRAWECPEAGQNRNESRWLRSWELVTTGAILAAIVSDILGSRLGYYSFGLIVLVGLIGYETLRDRAAPKDRENDTLKR